MLNVRATIRSASMAIALTGLLAVPALAQTAANTMAPGNTNTTNTNANNNGPSGSLMKTHGMWRSGDINGATVYDPAGKNIGTIDNLLLNSSGTASEAIVSIGGFIGVGTKLVEVPFSRLTFKESAGDNSAGNSTNNQTNYSIVLKAATKDSLTKMPSFSYQGNNQS